MQTATHVKTATLVGVALLAGSGIAAAIITMSSVSKPTLAVMSVPLPTSFTAVKGASSVPVYGVALSARNDDVIMDNLVFTVVADTDADFSTVQNDVVARDHISSCSVYDGVSGTLVGGPAPVDATGHLSVSLVGLAVIHNTTKKLAVLCNFANIDVDGGTPDAYAFSIVSDTDVLVHEAKLGTPLKPADIGVGGPLDPGINLTGQDRTIVVKQNGSLAGALDGTTPASDIILSDSTAVPVATLDFTATDEAFTIDKLSFANAGDDDVAAIVTITYPIQAGSTQTKSNVLSGGVVTFSGLPMYVPAGKTSVMTVTVDTNSIVTGVANSGDELALALTGSANFEAVGMSSGTSITSVSSMDIPTNTFVLRQTRPTFALDAASPAGMKVPGRAEVLRFSVSADAQDDVDLSQMLFPVTSTDSAASGWNACGNGANDVFADATRWALYDITNLATPISDAGDWSFLKADGSTCAQDASPVAYAVLDLAADATTGSETIAAGSTKTYVLYVDTSGASAANDDVFRTDIANESAADGISEDAIHWSDGFATDITGTYVKSLPVTGGTLVF